MKILIKILKILLVIIAVIALAAWWFYESAIKYADNEKFDAQQWQKERLPSQNDMLKLGPDMDRRYMTDDLVKKYIHSGVTTEEEVLKLLGEPEDIVMDFNEQEARQNLKEGQSLRSAEGKYSLEEEYKKNYQATGVFFSGRPSYYRRISYFTGIKMGFDYCFLNIYINERSTVTRTEAHCS